MKINLISYAGLFLGILIILANGLILIAVATSSKLRKKRYAFMISLTASDFLVGVIATLLFNPFYYEYIGHKEALENVELCRTAVLLLILSPCLSITNLFGLTLERYIAVYYPFKYEIFFSGKVLAGSIVSCWTLSLIMALLSLPGYNTSDYCPKLSDMTTIFKIVLSSVIILSVIGYSAIYCVILKEIRKSQMTNTHLHSSKRHNIVIIMVITFAVCWIPKCLILILQDTANLHEEHPLNLTTTCIAALNSLISPFLLVWRQTDFRVVILYLLRRMCIPPFERCSEMRLKPTRIGVSELGQTTLSVLGKSFQHNSDQSTL